MLRNTLSLYFKCNSDRGFGYNNNNNNNNQGWNNNNNPNWQNNNNHNRLPYNPSGSNYNPNFNNNNQGGYNNQGGFNNQYNACASSPCLNGAVSLITNI